MITRLLDKPEYVEDAINILNSSYAHGLLRRLPPGGNPSTANGMPACITKTKQGFKNGRPDLLLTDGIIFYADHLLYGKMILSLYSDLEFRICTHPGLNPETFKRYITIGISPSVLMTSVPIFLVWYLLDILSNTGLSPQWGWQPVPAG